MFGSFKSIGPDIPYIVAGVGITLLYAICSVLLGFCGGLVLALMKRSHSRLLRLLPAAYISIFRGTPLLLQLFLVYFSLPQLLGCDISPFAAGLIAFSFNSAAYVAEILRAGMESVPGGQLEVAAVMGLSRWKILRHILLPQALRNVLPALVNEVIALIKESALISTIGEADLLRRANVVASQYYVYLPPLLIAALCYYILVTMVSQVANRLERKLSCSR